MKSDHKNITNTNTLSICLSPPLTYRTSTFPLRAVCRYFLGADKNLPDEFVLNMKVARNESTITDTISTCLSDVSNTAKMEPSPPDHLSGNHPEPVVHPRMNSRFEQRALHCVRAPLTLHMFCHDLVCNMLAL